MRPIHCKATLISLCFVVLCTISAYGGTIYVKTDGSDSNDGSSWGLAKKTVQAGLNAAVTGDEVWVAEGTYVENITLTPGVALYGGFHRQVALGRPEIVLRIRQYWTVIPMVQS